MLGGEPPSTAVVPAGVPELAELEQRGALIGRIEVHVQNIFDLSDPREDRFLYRAANHLHYTTREATVRSQLLFKGGEPLRTQRLAETERLLRGRRYLVDAWVVPIAYDAATNVVDISVTVRDVWTLNPGVSLGRAGGKSHGSVEIDEGNLLGLGSRISLSRSRDVDRTSTSLSYFDPTLRHSWWQLGLEYADNSDGRTHSVSLVRPFYSLDTRRALGFSSSQGWSHVTRYSRGDIVDQFEEDRRYQQAYVGGSSGLVDGVTHRWYAGVRQDIARFTPAPGLPTPFALPMDRELAYPWVGWQILQDRYQKSENVDLIGRTEDLFLGRALYAELGYSSSAFGGRGSAIIGHIDVQDAWLPAPGRQLFLNASVDGRRDAGVIRNLKVAAGARYFVSVTDHQESYAALAATLTRRLDGDQQLLLGGDNGLRGYPLRFQGGDKSALLTLEHRVYTDWYPFRLVRVGGAAFFDAGRTWGPDVFGAQPLGTLKDLGIGLRLGNNRSGLGNVLHVDLSYAMDAPAGTRRIQVTVETKDRF